ncbi:MAG: crossover junction endodeoxyribonuclease RuvC [Ignavibacteria bacterium]|jgi:crossover junction endodeoxyribonuclease RuvC|nr:crossover junction endodeoxyribonuclease RuvC [Ignavibacteria bacterium]
MRIIGIDPGSIICGFAIIDKSNTKIEALKFDAIKFKSKSEGLNFRLNQIFNSIKNIIVEYEPKVAVFENVFYAKNAQSLIKLTAARTAAVLAALQFDIPIYEFTPREIKKSVTGLGNASKKQVLYMVKNILKIEEEPRFYDASDALAVALCYCFREQQTGKSSQSWSEFIKNNPHRVVSK